jgi:hypothetical protein
MNNISASLVTVLIAIIGLATLAVIVSKRAGTTDVITAAGSTFNQLLKTAVSPVA